MDFNVEKDTFIVLAYFRSGFRNGNGEWRYSHRQAYEEFVEMYPEEEVAFPVFSRHCSRAVERYIDTGNVGKGKSSGRPTVATQDIVERVDEIIQRNPHISINRVSQQIGRYKYI